LSHIPQRKEKDCLNCGTIVQGKYCQQCGQENVVPHETFGHMVKHFAYDITHFDTKFFDSMKHLLFRPGFLPTEYMKGKRASYLNPIKKYVFTSAIFFLLFFSFFVSSKSITTNLNEPLSKEERLERIRKAEKELSRNPNNTKLDSALVILKDTSRAITLEELLAYWGESETITVGNKKYKNLEEYDSTQQALPAAERDNWFVKLFQRKGLKAKAKYGKEPGGLSSAIFDTFLHKLPYMLFVSLPFFALILKLLYIRRKEYYYADHGIFSIYHYVFTFFLLAIVFTLDKLSDIKGLGFLDLVEALLFLSGGLYLYLSMKRFYKQGHGKTLVKFILLNLIAFIFLLILFVGFLLLSVFQI
jgi:Protein of unknown function (DUF3667)